MFEVGLIVLLGRTVLSGLLKVLGFAGKLLLIVLAIALAVFAVSKIVQIIKGKSDTEETRKKDVDFVPGNQETDEGKESEGTELHSESETVAEDVKIEETENVYDIGLAEEKDFVESSAKTLKGMVLVRKCVGKTILPLNGLFLYLYCYGNNLRLSPSILPPSAA